MRYNYGRLRGSVYITHTELLSDNTVSLHFEEFNPEIRHLKEFEMILPQMTVVKDTGFSSQDKQLFVQFAYNNARDIYAYSKVGGIENA